RGPARLGVRAVRRPALPDLLLAEAVLGARAHGQRARPADRRDRARHAALLPRELRDARAARRALRPQPDPAGGDHGRRAAPPRGPEPLGARPRSLLPHPQGRAAPAVRGVDVRHPPRPVPEPRGHAEDPVVGPVRGLEAAPARGLGREAHLGLHPRQRDPLQPAARDRLPVDRVHPVHPADGAGRGGARRPLGGLGQARVRHPRRRRFMTENIHAHDHPESDRVRPGGFTLWFTGLSGSGKSTIAHVVGPELDRRGLVVEYLDGDTVRTHLSKGLGFSKEDRDTNIERIGWVASRLTRQGGAVLAAAISPYRETRQRARELVEAFGPFVEVHVATSLEECARRDVNGLYAKAFAGEIKGFTGVDDPYEPPEDPEIVVETEGKTPEESAQLVIEKLEQLGL